MVSGVTACKACGREMLSRVSCDERAGATRHGDESYCPLLDFEPAPNCKDCGCPVGGFHQRWCDVDECPHGQRLGCEVCNSYPQKTTAAGCSPGGGRSTNHAMPSLPCKAVRGLAQRKE